MKRYHILKLSLIIYAAYFMRPMLGNYVHADYAEDNRTVPVTATEDYLVYYQGVEGTPGIDFPIYSHIPKTSFSCKGIDSGYYADLDTDCQVFHICEDERKISFLCPNGTIFQQSDLICEWWFKVNCTDAPSLYGESAEHLRADTARRELARKLHADGQKPNHGAVMRTEEASSISAQRDGKNLRISSNIVLASGSVSYGTQNQLIGKDNEERQTTKRQRQQTESSTFKNFKIDKSAISTSFDNDEAIDNNLSKNRRYNDNQAGNFVNNYKPAKDVTQKDNIVPDNTERNLSSNGRFQASKEYNSPFQSTSPSIDKFYDRQRIDISPNKIQSNYIQNTNPNRGDVKYSFSIIPGTSKTNSFANNQNDDKSKNIDKTNENIYSVTKSNTQRPSRVNDLRPAGDNRKNYIEKGESNDSEESQITQESASFVQSPFNSIQDKSNKYSTSNPYPNHRVTYSDLKRPNFASTRFASAISSVTPQYITTQPINNGRPFLGTRVGVKIRTSDNIVTEKYQTTPIPNFNGSLTDNDLSNAPFNNYNDISSTSGPGEEKHISRVKLLGKLRTFSWNSSPAQVTSSPLTIYPAESAISESSSTFRPQYQPADYSVQSNIKLNVENSPKLKNSSPLSGNVPDTYFNLDAGATSSSGISLYSDRQPIVSTTITPFQESTSKRAVDHATIYGLYSKDISTTPIPSPNSEVLNEAAETISPYNSDRGVPIKFKDNSNRVGLHLVKSINGDQTSLRPNINQGVQVKFDKNYDKVGVHLSKVIGAGNTISARPFVNIKSTASPDENPKYGHSANPPLLHLNAFVHISDVQTTEITTTESAKEEYSSSGRSYIPISLTSNQKFQSSVQPPFLSVNANINTKDIQRIKDSTPGSGFFVSKNSVYDSSTAGYYQSTPSISVSPNSYFNEKSTTQRPRPFQRLQYSTLTTDKSVSVTPPYVSYKISSAAPFKPKAVNLITTQPTQPTLLPTSTISADENIDNMINILMEFAKTKERDYSGETPRPGLVVPPSAGPQTLHTLAVYFSNALDKLVAERGKFGIVDDELEAKEKFTNLLTEMTMHGYSQLFRNQQEEETTTSHITSTQNTNDVHNGLELQASGNLVQSPQIRELARNFSIALSSYLNDPEMFRKDLKDLRPTEPPPLDVATENTQANSGDEELLNFSDTDSKSSIPPIFPTIPTPSPTWGLILATKSQNSLDIKNSLNPDLNTADSQSFVPNFNNANADYSGNKYKSEIPPDLPEGHWTTSPSATKLWQTTLSVNPFALNEHFGTTPAIPSSESESGEDFSAPDPLPDDDQPHKEIQYELRTLPKLSLNSSQIHGILIDFMNTTTPDSEKLHRILKKLNTTEDEFLTKMKEIESNPLTKRLILLLISECGEEATKDIEKFSDNKPEFSELSSSSSVYTKHTENKPTSNTYVPKLVSTSLGDDEQDTRALQLLNSLYSIASKFGK